MPLHNGKKIRLAGPECRQHLVTAEGELRSKNQITLSRLVMDVLQFHVGDQLIFVVDECDPTVVHIHRVPDSYAGALAGVYGSPDDAKAYIRGEREAWEA